jgi:hypothetical protein
MINNYLFILKKVFFYILLKEGKITFWIPKREHNSFLFIYQDFEI